MSGSGSGPSAAPVHGGTSIAPGSIQELIVDTLAIPHHLTDRCKGDIRMAYTKYLKCLDAMKTVSKMKTSGTWPHASSNDDIIEIFFSKSSYYKNHAKIFPKLHRYPAMQDWFQNDGDSPADHQVWGHYRHTFENLQKILNAYASPPPKEKNLQDDSS